jgi:hypothetical protein
VWDTCVVYVERRQRWWWNAWRPSTCTELSGFADSQEEAARAMLRAIEDAGPSPTISMLPTVYRSADLPRNDRSRQAEG